MTRGACASGDSLSAQAGAQMLYDGGNAVDAAVAAALMSCVTLPTMTGLAGAGIVTARVNGEVHVLDFFANVPGLGASDRGPRTPDAVVVEFEGIPLTFHIGVATVAVPGTIAGLWALQERLGKLPMSEVAAPAIAAARDGFVCTTAQGRSFRLLAGIFGRDPESWAVVSNGEVPVIPGETLANRPIADVLDLVVRDGARAFYEGPLAEKMIEASAGWLTKGDLRNYQPKWQRPLRGSYRDWTLHMPGAPCMTGGMGLASFAELDKGAPIEVSMQAEDWNRVADAMAAGEAVRTPEYEQRLFDDGYLESVVAKCPGGSTMHCSTADADGNLVAYTTSLGESAGIAVPGTGIVLNNFLGEDDILPAESKNRAGRRMMTSMCPTIASNGEHAIAVGSAGSSRIRTAIFQTLVHRIDRGRSLQDAVWSPRIHMEGGTLFVEGFGRPADEVAALRALTPLSQETRGAGFYFGGVQAVELGPNGSIEAAADTQRRGCVAVIV